VIAYFDTSALVKLVISEDGAEQAWLLWQEAAEAMISRLAYPEALAALAAARRDHRLTDDGYEQAVAAFHACYDHCTVVSVADRIVNHAAEIAPQYDLRAADAIHLATALAVVEPDAMLVTWDTRLRQAAIQAGLAAAPATLDFKGFLLSAPDLAVGDINRANERARRVELDPDAEQTD